MWQTLASVVMEGDTIILWQRQPGGAVKMSLDICFFFLYNSIPHAVKERRDANPGQKG